MAVELDEATKKALQEQAPKGTPGEAPEKQNVPGTPEQPGKDVPPDLPEVELKLDESSVEPEVTPEVKPDDNTALDKQAVDTLQEAGYTEEDVLKRLETDGGFTDEFIAELKSKINPAIVDAHVGRIKAEIELEKIRQATNYDAKNKAIQDMNDYIHGAVGGRKNFDTMSKLLVQEMNAEDISRIDAKLQSGNKALVNEGLKEMDAAYKKARGMGGNLMQGNANVEAQRKMTHITKEEYRAIMRTEKYKTDSAYAAQVDADRLTTKKADSERYGKGSYFGYHPTKGRYAL